MHDSTKVLERLEVPSMGGYFEVIDYVVIHPETFVDIHFDDRSKAEAFADSVGSSVHPVIR